MTKENERYLHILFDRCDGNNCPGGFVPNWKTLNLKSKKEVIEATKKK